MKLGIYIPSRGRAGAVRTLAAIPASRLKDTHIVATHGQGAEYFGHYKDSGAVVVEAPKAVKNIGMKRDFMVDHALRYGYTHIVMLDDDLIFAKRRTDDLTRLEPCVKPDFARMFKVIEQRLKTHVHVGIVAREGANRHTEPVLYATRMMRVLAYDLRVLSAYKLKFTRIPVMEDFDVTLSLLRKGHPNAVIAEYTNDQGSSNAPGGCSGYRTPEVQAASAEGLRKLHPEFVKVVQKTTKGSWGGGTRTDVNVAWKKALASSSQGVLI